MHKKDYLKTRGGKARLDRLKEEYGEGPLPTERLAEIAEELLASHPVVEVLKIGGAAAIQRTFLEAKLEAVHVHELVLWDHRTFEDMREKMRHEAAAMHFLHGLYEHSRKMYAARPEH